jgi:hypothetical protein
VAGRLGLGTDRLGHGQQCAEDDEGAG